ncbi:MAG TPA: hypothetical protein VF826_07745 [Chloroflexia bacterium]
MQLNVDGTLGESFGDGGLVVTSFPNDAMAHAVAVEPDGKVTVVGSATLRQEDRFDTYFGILRYKWWGSGE